MNVGVIVGGTNTVAVIVGVGTGVLVGVREGVQVGNGVTVGTGVKVAVGSGVFVGGMGVGVTGFSNRFACCKHSGCENSGTVSPVTALMPRICTFAHAIHEYSEPA